MKYKYLPTDLLIKIGKYLHEMYMVDLRKDIVDFGNNKYIYDFGSLQLEYTIKDNTLNIMRFIYN